MSKKKYLEKHGFEYCGESTDEINVHIYEYRWKNRLFEVILHEDSVDCCEINENGHKENILELDDIKDVIFWLNNLKKL